MRSYLAVIALAIGLVVVSCGGEEEVTQPTVAPTGSPEGPVSTPEPRPTVEGNQVTSLTKGYRVVFPAGWEPTFNLLTGTYAATDAYFAPEVQGEVHPNIAIMCDRSAGGVQPEEFFEVKVRVIERLAGAPVQTEETTVAGRPALRIAHTHESLEAPTVDKIEVFLVGPRCGYTVALTAAEGAIGDLTDAFDAFLESLEVFE